MKRITILGATGSIGVNTLEIIADNPHDFTVYALTAHQNISLLYEQCLQFKPRYVVLASADLAQTLSEKLKQTESKTRVLYGESALIEVVTADEVDVVMAAIVGIAGLKPTYAAVEKGKTILLANKEALVTAGEIFMAAVKHHNAILLPVDSEHNAIFQCLPCANKYYDDKAVSRIILTASGGPFRDKLLTELQHITPDQACAHPNWKMGRKISVDSSTMMNKALEVIEAYWLFDVPYNKIEVLIHPQSIVHSMVEYHDGSFLAQMGSPDMKTPIAYAMYYPNRHKINVSKLNFVKKPLSFEALDGERFRVIPLVYEILKYKNYSATITLNAANEVLVNAFLAEKIQYLQIIKYIEHTLKMCHFDCPKTIDDVIRIDQDVRTFVRDLLK
ncbi:1-deoxy-D-xylulose-5-phosphate reductoisomerase [Fastidiosibacter lacustris]|uniref:1-deoxy-D-xylulose-5-phosphate reductoisomerase n=1 Tax=Fastidiosibacter lacustris TaxID=2056695 RepID=UPI000E35741C|nr:1-deoxy-D-xylulose-5-phosphate reductoisomerase [Fastidiosibacter lacustris]